MRAILLAARKRPRPTCSRPATACALLAVWVVGLALPMAAAAAPLLWVTPTADGAATLAADGRVTLLAVDGKPHRLASSARGDSMRLCGGELLGVGAGGHLRSWTGTAVGPAVSPHSRPACLPDGNVVAISSDAHSVLLLSADLTTLARRPLEALPDGDPIALGDAVAILSQPTQRYRHGVLGDEIEAGAVTLLRQTDLVPIATYTVPPPAVIEQRRVQPFAAAGAYGMLVTRSSPTEGAGIEALAQRGRKLTVVAAAPPIGIPDRWSNLFAADGRLAFAVRTPDLGGPLEVFRLLAGSLRVSRYALDVTNHQLGSRNLDLAVLLPPPATGSVDVLALPTRDLATVQIVACGAASCIAEAQLSLEAPLSSNLAARWHGGKLLLYAGEHNGELQSFTLDATLWQPPPPP